MEELFSRFAMLTGEEGIERLSASHVAVFGLGGVGGSAAEALARAGVGTLTLVDADTVAPSNRNRQAISFSDTDGMEKTAAAASLLHRINPGITVYERPVFFDASTRDAFDFSAFDFVLDCIDTVTSKLLLIECCRAVSVPIACSMGTGNKLDPSRLRLTDLEKTSVCPLARVMRLECRKRGIRHLPVVWSDEPPLTPVAAASDPAPAGKRIPGSAPFVPPAAGLLLASAAVRSIVFGETF